MRLHVVHETHYRYSSPVVLSQQLLHLTPRSSRVMTITKLLTVFEAFDDEEEAVRSFKAIV